MQTRVVLSLILCAALFADSLHANSASTNSEDKAPWPASYWSNSNFFPIAVWLQNPSNADRYRQAGINTYVALWKGPTEEQIAKLKQAGMKLICGQNEVGLKHLDDPTIVGWMHGDEPDNAQATADGKGWGPPITPETIVGDYHQIKKADPKRPVMLNLGQGVAWDGWYGRGVRGNHPEDYPKYIEGGDVVSFDIYPAVHDRPEVAGNLWYVARGVERLVQWSDGKKTIWNCLECTRISNVDRKPTPHEVKCEAWMSLIHGSRGFIYFIHQFKPVFREAALLDDPEMLAAVTGLNRQITQLAPVLNSPTVTGKLVIESGSSETPVAAMLKEHAGASYVFAVCMRGNSTAATFKLDGLPEGKRVQVIGENRDIQSAQGFFADKFGPWDVHLYRFEKAK